MEFEFVEFIDRGGCADVYKIISNLGLIYAAKILRDEDVLVSDALAHARALARVDHPNVVKVYSIEKHKAPEGNEEVDCIIMEFLDGEDLEVRLTKNKFIPEEAYQICEQILNGMEGMHALGLIHGDLHEKNIRITSKGVKLIDILYFKTLAAFSASRKTHIVAQDIASAKTILGKILYHSTIKRENLTVFDNASLENAIPALREALRLCRTLDTPVSGVDYVMKYYEDEHFAPSRKFADSLLRCVKSEEIMVIWKRLIAGRKTDRDRTAFVSGLWARTRTEDQPLICQMLGEWMERQMSPSNWRPHVRLFLTVGTDKWHMVADVVRLRLEHIMVKDIRSGKEYSNPTSSSGLLGQTAALFGRYFDEENMKDLVDVICWMLNGHAAQQDYIGNYFIPLLCGFNIDADQRKRLIDALVIGFKGSAKIRRSIHQIPEEWAKEFHVAGQGEVFFYSL